MAALGLFVQILAIILLIAIFIRVIFSWTGMNPESPVYAFVHEITEPILAPIRQFMPRGIMIDFSPMVAMLILFIILRAAISIQ